MGSQDLFVRVIADWRFLGLIGAALVSSGGMWWQVKRLLALHAPDRVIEQARAEATLIADFATAQEDIKNNLARLRDLEKKVRADVIALHQKIDGMSGGD